MRKQQLVGAIAGGLILVCMAAAVQADCGCGGMSNRSYNSLSGPPCFSPPGCSLAPGCCECPPSACDNAWAGYCQHKAKWQAYFTKVGTPRPSYYYGNYGNCGRCGSPTPAVREVPAEDSPAPKPAVAPEPAKPAMPPAPAPEKTSRAKVLYPWMR
jgi:hypothetical protein